MAKGKNKSGLNKKKNETKQRTTSEVDLAGYGDKKLDGPDRPST